MTPSDHAYVVVPREATEAMKHAAGEEIVRQYAASEWEEAKDVVEEIDADRIFAAMIAASPPTSDQPAAWVEYADNGNVRWFSASKESADLRRDGATLIPLYASPPQPAPDGDLEKAVNGIMAKHSARLAVTSDDPDSPAFGVNYALRSTQNLRRDILTALQAATAAERARGDQSWQDFLNDKRKEWQSKHPDKGYADLHARWWTDPKSVPYVEDGYEIVEAVVAALIQEGNAAWNGDATGIVSHMIRAQSDLRKAAEAANERLVKALEDAPRPNPTPDPVAYMDWFFKVRIAALSAEGKPSQEKTE